MKRISKVAWALPPGRKHETRPAQLISNLIELGLVTDDVQYHFHGRTPAIDGWIPEGSFFPRVNGLANRELAVLSPIFVPRLQRASILWADYYDDWSIAPDINPLHRLHAAISYSNVRHLSSGLGMVTCNTPYMAAKLGLEKERIVPNGVDPKLANIARTGDDAFRIIILGHLFKGRTDLKLLRQALLEWPADEIILGAPGQCAGVAKILRQAEADRRPIRIFDWLSPERLCQLVGRRTVALVPHIVSDYTLSQDMMKLYQFISMGMKVVCPRWLWPSHIDMKYAFLLDFGADTTQIREWAGSFTIADAERVGFAEENSWRARAREIGRLISESFK